MPTRDQVLPVGPPVSLEYEIGRRRDIEAVRKALSQHDEDLVLIDLRSTGKTTVALCALDLILSGGDLVFSIDLETAPSSSEVAQRLTAQLTGQRENWAGVVQDARATLTWIYERGQGVATALSDDDAKQLRAALQLIKTDQAKGVDQLTAALDAIEQLAQERDRNAVIFLDEIQAIAEWPDTHEAQAELRGRLKSTGGHLRFLFAGSKPRVVKELFDRGGLLDFHGIEHHLSPIKERDWRDGLRRAFDVLGCEIDDRATDEILEASELQPLRTMLAARETHALAETNKVPPVADYGVAVIGVAHAKKSHLWNLGEQE